MNRIRVASDNYAFYFVVIAKVLNDSAFLHYMYESLLFAHQTRSYEIKKADYPGILQFNLADIIEEKEAISFMEKMHGGILQRVSLQIPKSIRGVLNREMEIIDGFYRFSFKIAKYQRDQGHGLEMVEETDALPNDERLVRIVDAKIAAV